MANTSGPNLSSAEGDELQVSHEVGKPRKRVETGVKRYNLVLPEALFNEVQKIADAEHTTVVDLLRRFIKLGLLATQPNVTLIIREGGRERELLLLT